MNAYNGAVTLYGEEPSPPYRRPPLSKEFLRGEIGVEDLWLEQPGWFGDNNVELALAAPVTAIDPAGASLMVAGGRREADVIVLATGSRAVRPPIPGVEDPAVLTLRTLADSSGLVSRSGAGRHAVVLGTGFIGCEIAASLAITGERVTIIGDEAAPQLSRIGDDAARRLAGWLSGLGIEVRCGNGASAVHEARTVELADGSRIAADYVVLGLGARPRGSLARDAGARMHGDAVLVDEHMRSHSFPRTLLAAGDVAHAFNSRAARHLRVEHWGDAITQGEVAGRTLAGVRCEWDEVPGFWSTIGEHTIKHVGWGDCHRHADFLAEGGDAFTVLFSGGGGAAVGVPTHEHDADHTLAAELISAQGPDS